MPSSDRLYIVKGRIMLINRPKSIKVRLNQTIGNIATLTQNRDDPFCACEISYSTSESTWGTRNRMIPVMR